jgi:hypothetical protein
MAAPALLYEKRDGIAYLTFKLKFYQRASEIRR